MSTADDLRAQIAIAGGVQPKSRPEDVPCSGCGAVDWKYEYAPDAYRCGRCDRRVYGENMRAARHRVDQVKAP